MKYVQAIVFCLMSYVLLPGWAVAAGAEFNYRDRVDIPALKGADVQMRFEFHSASNGTAAALFSTNMTVHVASSGVFCAEVGVRDGLFDTTNDRYLAVYEPSAVGGKPSVLLRNSRRRLMPVPTAIYAQKADVAPDGFVVHGKTHLLGGLNRHGQDLLYGVDKEGGLSVTDLSAKDVSGDNGKFNQMSVGGALTMTKRLILKDEGGRTFTGTNAALVVKGLEAKSVTLPIPTGLIMMWYGEANRVPPGWALCDGGVHDGVKTPDLTGRFIVGATSASDEWYSYQTPGGERNVTLTSEQIPAHDHTYFGDDQLALHATTATEGRHGYDAISSDKSGNSAWFMTGDTGENMSHENRPPFRAVYYIMKIR